MFLCQGSDTNHVGRHDEEERNQPPQWQILSLFASCYVQLSDVKNILYSAAGQFFIYIFQIFL